MDTKTETKPVFDADAANNAKDVGMAFAAAKYASVLEAAKAIAIELGKVAPITVDNVTKRLNDLGYATSKRNSWKGSIFKGKAWVCIGYVASTSKISHGRPVRMWALKSWLTDHKINGMRLQASAFDLTGIYHEFRHVYDLASGNYNWIIGKSQLATTMLDAINNGGGKLFGIPVQLVDTAVGAMLTKVAPAAPVSPAIFSRPDLGKDGKSPW